VIKFSLLRPVVIAVGVILILMFGLISMYELPRQLTPNVIEPKISINTVWPGASPKEIESDIIAEQELALKNTPNIVEYESKSRDNSGSLTLTFKLGTDINKAMLDVANKLNEVDNYPLNVQKPVIKATGESASPVIWTMVQTLDDNPTDINNYKSFLDDEIKPQYERINGVAELFMRAGTPDELQIILDTQKMASYALTIDKIINIIQANSVDVSAGSMDVGRRSYRIRTTSQYRTINDAYNIVLLSTNGKEVKLGDIAKVEFAHAKKTSISLVDGIEGLVVGFKPVNGTNIITLTNDVEAVVKRLNATILKEKGLKVRWLNDKRGYIQGSISLVQKNIIIGGLLAVIVLMLFLRSVSSTAVIAMAIPISIIATFIVLEFLGRSLNTISLAGISFSVGMLVDSAIVVLENIDRHKTLGKSYFQAAFDGTKEVWGALIASALTTIAVFLPIVFLQNEAGQLFKDIALAVSIAVSFSLFVSISVIPMLWMQLMRFSKHDTHQEKEADKLQMWGAKTSQSIMNIITKAMVSTKSRLITVVSLVIFSVGISYILFPKLEYLPQGNRNLIFNIMIPPPGLSYAEKRAIGEKVWEKLEPYAKEEKDGFPQIQRLFFIAGGDFMLFGTLTKDPSRASELIPLTYPVANSFPGIFGISKQASVFARGLGKGRTIDVDISGSSIEELTQASSTVMKQIKKVFKKIQIRPVPSLEVSFPEVQIIPDRSQLAALGMSSLSLGVIADVLMDGRKIGEYKQEGKPNIDLILKADQENMKTPEDIYNAIIATPSGKLVSFSTLSRLKRTTSMSEIRHLNGKRTITLQVSPPTSITIGESIEMINRKVLDPLLKEGKLDRVKIELTGTADKLLETIDSMKWNLALAVVIIYLLMSALFGHFAYPLIIMVTLPLAMAGGFIGLSVTNTFISYQPLDILTMLGFVILIGIVVNNAILIVYQSLHNMKDHAMHYRQAVLDATHTRLRPIFMSTLTSLFGMLPLVLAPGPGSEFYRGLGSVITGGLAFSTLFTLFVIPALLLFVLKFESKSLDSKI
jgi:hydrophobic/amphiphilic exporter-1 (mainly G- bacteria), HAE1 family